MAKKMFSKAAIALVLALVMVFSVMSGTSVAFAAPSGGSSSGNFDLDLGSWKNTYPVLWDEYNADGTDPYAGSVASVTLNGVAVEEGNSRDSTPSGGRPLSEYFSSAATTTKEETVTLAITTVDGYYVTEVVIVCTCSNQNTCYHCSTHEDDNAYHRLWDVTFHTEGTTFAAEVSSLHFSHTSNKDNNNSYIILIKTAAGSIVEESELYVQYNAGSILELDNAFFSDETAWLTARESWFDEAEDCAHTVGSISEEAIEAAAKLGYTFTGWTIEYYINADAENEILSEQTTLPAGYPTSAQSGDELTNLITHARIIALWEKTPGPVDPDPVDPDPVDPDPVDPDPVDPDPVDPDPVDPDPVDPDPVDPDPVDPDPVDPDPVDPDPVDPDPVDPDPVDPDPVDPDPVDPDPVDPDPVDPDPVDPDPVDPDPVDPDPVDPDPVDPDPVDPDPVDPDPVDPDPVDPDPVDPDPVEIPDDDVPRSDNPYTGDPIVLYAAMAAVSGTGTLTLLQRRKKEQDEEA